MYSDWGTLAPEVAALADDSVGQALAFGRGAVTAYERNSSIDRLFSLRARERPEACAVVGPAGSRSYAQVDRTANRVANHLLALGVKPGSSVGVGFGRSLDLPSVLLGILRAGAAYLPLDPAYPQRRLAAMVEDAATAFVMTDERLGSFPDTPAKRVDLSAAFLASSEWALSTPSGPTSLAYVMYTSGSTGRPKGVAIEHRSVLRLVRGQDYVAIDQGDAFLHLAPLGFDASTLEIWGPLLNGARLAVPRPGLLAINDIADAIERFEITTLWMTAALFHEMVDARPAAMGRLRQLLAGGDVLSPRHVRQFARDYPDCRLINGYGPTENTTFSCCYTVSPDHAVDGAVPIGRPIANSTAYILDDALQPVGVGDAGELCVGGDGIARGYVNLAQLTADRFVRDPFSTDASSRLYRTGDRARWRSDGVVEFLGRTDDQVKVRGYRIELGEIESALRTFPGVRDAAVVVAVRNGAKELVAHVSAEPNEPALRAHLSATLAPHMIPNRFVFASQLPLTANGKIDRARLAREAEQVAASGALRPAKNGTSATERTIASIWSELLGGEREFDENFFDAGGDSLRLLAMHTKLRERLHVAVSVTDLFEQTTIRKLAAFVDRAGASA